MSAVIDKKDIKRKIKQNQITAQVFEDNCKTDAEKEIIRLRKCSDYFLTDVYSAPYNVIDIKHVNRCKSKYCGICAQIKARKNALRITETVLKEKKPAYHFSITVPNAQYGHLKEEIKNLNSYFAKFYKYHTNKNNKTLFKFIGAVKTIEITVNEESNTYHQHLHVLIVTDKPINPRELIQDISTYNGVKHSEIEIEIGTYFRNLAKNNKYPHFEVRIEEIKNKKGIYEVSKYPIKNKLLHEVDGKYVSEIFKAFKHLNMIKGSGIFYKMLDIDEIELDAKIKPNEKEVLIRLVNGIINNAGKQKLIPFNDIIELYHDFDILSIGKAQREKLIIQICVSPRDFLEDEPLINKIISNQKLLLDEVVKIRKCLEP